MQELSFRMANDEKLWEQHALVQLLNRNASEHGARKDRLFRYHLHFDWECKCLQPVIDHHLPYNGLGVPLTHTDVMMIIFFVVRTAFSGFS